MRMGTEGGHGDRGTSSEASGGAPCCILVQIQARAKQWRGTTQCGPCGGDVRDACTTLCQCEGQCECLDEVSAISHFLDGVTKNKAIEPLFKNIHGQISKDPEHKWLATALAAAIRQETQPWQQDPELDTVRWMRALGTLKNLHARLKRQEATCADSAALASVTVELEHIDRGINTANWAVRQRRRLTKRGPDEAWALQ